MAFRFTALERGADGGVAATGAEGRAKVRVQQLAGDPAPDVAALSVSLDAGDGGAAVTTVECFGMQDGACVFVVRAADGAEARLTVSAGEQIEVFPGNGRHGVRLSVE